MILRAGESLDPGYSPRKLQGELARYFLEVTGPEVRAWLNVKSTTQKASGRWAVAWGTHGREWDVS